MIDILNLQTAPEFLPVLAQWHQNEWSYLNPGQMLTHRIEKMQSFLNDQFIPSTFIAKNETVVGSASIVKNDMATMPQLSPWLASVFVAAEHRNNGIGARLVLHVMAQAKHQGIKTLYLFTPDKIDFYKKFGWHIHSQSRYHGHQVSVMQVILTTD